MHLVKIGQVGSASDDLTGKHESKMFNMTLKNSKLIEVASEGTVILVHYHGTPVRYFHLLKQSIN